LRSVNSYGAAISQPMIVAMTREKLTDASGASGTGRRIEHGKKRTTK
jgi:hypothetical protein